MYTQPSAITHLAIAFYSYRAMSKICKNFIITQRMRLSRRGYRRENLKYPGCQATQLSGEIHSVIGPRHWATQRSDWPTHHLTSPSPNVPEGSQQRLQYTV